MSAAYATAECAGCHIRLPKPEMHQVRGHLRFRFGAFRSYYNSKGELRGRGAPTFPFKRGELFWLCEDCYRERLKSRGKSDRIVLRIVLLIIFIALVYVSAETAAKELNWSILALIIAVSAVFGGAVAGVLIWKRRKKARQAQLAQREQVERVERKEEEKARREEELGSRFGPECAQSIISGELFAGMTKEMLLEAWGEPDDLQEERVRSTIKQTWKYDQVGVNRYENRVYLENDVVVGFKGRRWIHG